MKNVELADSDDNNEARFFVCWFNGNKESMEEYHKEYSRKAFMRPKFLGMELLRNENHSEVADVLKFQKLEKFVNLSRIYPDLVKVFLLICGLMRP